MGQKKTSKRNILLHTAKTKGNSKLYQAKILHVKKANEPEHHDGRVISAR